MTPSARAIIALVAMRAMVCAAEVEQHDTIRKSFPAATSIDIDNVFGSIHVSPAANSGVEVEARRTLRADDEERAEAARREVKLDVSDSAGAIRFYVDGPFRCNCGERRSFRSRNNFSEHRRRGYKIIYDFEIKAPPGTALYLSTINEGKIVVDRSSGEFDIENINGGVQMNDVSGFGRVYALNGSVNITFVKNPERESYFGSLNGVVDVALQPDASADAQVKTFNGHVYTDFPVSYLPIKPAAVEHKQGKFVYRNNGFQGIRIGSGGPEYKFENFNGDIRIRNRGKQ